MNIKNSNTQKWTAINFYYPISRQSDLLRTLEAFCFSTENYVKTFFYNLKFEEIYCVRLSLFCSDAELKKNFIVINKMLQSDTYLKQFKPKIVPFYPNTTILHTDEVEVVFYKMSEFSSKVCLRLMLKENENTSYFNLLFRSIILNVLTVDCFLSHRESKLFFKYLAKCPLPTNYDSYLDSRFDMKEIADMLNKVDLKIIIKYARKGKLDICDEIESYIHETRMIINQLLSCLKKEKYSISNYSSDFDILKQSTEFNFLNELVKSNSNRMGVLEEHNKLWADMIYKSL